MIKKFMSLAIVAALSLGMTTMATARSHGRAAKDKTEQVSKSDKKCHRGGPKGEGPCDSLRQDRFDPFVGITLTDAQKSQLEALKPEGKCGEKPGKCGEKPEGQCKCPSCDSTAQRPDPRAAQREYLGKIKEILTPDQYVVFLENLVVSQPQGQPGQPGQFGGPGAPGQPGPGRPGEGPAPERR
jgi:uncharacterized low-complexity protein